MSKYFEITGTGQTKFGELYDKSLEELMFEATIEALNKAGKSITEIEAVVIGNMLNGSHLGAVFSEMFKFNGPVFRVEAACASGGVAIHTSLQALKAGNYKNVLVIGVEKMTDFIGEKSAEMLMQAASADERHAGLTFAGLYALMTEAYQQKYGLKRKELSLAPYLMHKNALTNSKAQFQKEFSLDEIEKSPVVAGQLRLLDCSPISDGAAAVVIETKDSPSKNGVYLLGSEMATDSVGLAERENVYSLKSTQLAMQKLREKFDLENQDIAAIEVHDCFSIALFMALEDMKICKTGQASAFLKKITRTGKNPEMLVNASGGLKASGHPVGATGVKQIVELTKVLKEGKSKKFAVAQNVGGTGGTAVLSLLTNFSQ